MPLPHMARVPGLILGVRWICRRQQMEGEDRTEQDSLEMLTKILTLPPS